MVIVQQLLALFGHDDPTLANPHSAIYAMSGNHSPRFRCG
jgi:hypothetical protein